MVPSCQTCGWPDKDSRTSWRQQKWKCWASLWVRNEELKGHVRWITDEVKVEKIGLRSFVTTPLRRCRNDPTSGFSTAFSFGLRPWASTSFALSCSKEIMTEINKGRKKERRQTGGLHVNRGGRVKEQKDAEVGTGRHEKIRDLFI